MQRKLILALLAKAAVTSAACTIPTTPLSNTITTPFRVQVQNASYLQVHNKFMNLLPSGGGDQHLYIGPVGVPTFDLTLVSGVIEHNGVRAVIGGEFSDIDDTTKMFMTERGDPRAVYAPEYACNPVTDELQIELRFLTWQNHPPGGWICVRPTYDNAHEFRYYPPGNAKVDPNRTCIKVTLVVIPSSGGGTTSSTTSATTTSSSQTTTLSTTTTSSSSSSPTTTVTTSTTVSTTSSSSSSQTTTLSTSTTSSATSSSSPLPFTDMTSQGFSFIGCAPEERFSNDGPGRTLPTVLYAEDGMTNEKCMDFCRLKGYKYAGTEYRRECWCANYYAPTRQPGTTRASLAGCSMTCMGNTAQICGGAAWLSLYQACAVGGPCVNAQFT